MSDLREKLTVTMTLAQLDKLETEKFVDGATTGQQCLISLLALVSRGLDPEFDRGKLSDAAWELLQKLISQLRPPAHNPNVVGIGGGKDAGGPEEG